MRHLLLLLQGSANKVALITVTYRSLRNNRLLKKVLARKNKITTEQPIRTT